MKEKKSDETGAIASQKADEEFRAAAESQVGGTMDEANKKNSPSKQKTL